jgi:Cu/Ag efflux protein CusF
MKIRYAAGAALLSAGLAGFAPVGAQTHPAATVKAAAASAPGAAMAARTIKITATIEALEPATRGVTLKGPEGKVFSLTAGPEIKNYDKLKVGDKVTAEYSQALSLELKKGGGSAPGTAQTQAATRAPAGQVGGAVGRQVTIVADVVEVSAEKKTVTLRGPKGNVVDLSVPDPGQLKNIKKGDQVEAVYTEALAVSVQPAAAK